MIVRTATVVSVGIVLALSTLIESGAMMPPT